MQQTEAIKTANEIITLYEMYGNEDYIGEPVSQIEHMCQCARLAEEGNFDDEVILAAFFHDIGHLCEHIMEVEYMDKFGIINHEKIGAEYLKKKGFSNRITTLVGSHVNAKRYLTFRNPGYFAQLSEASKNTLKFQKGRMTEAEANAFEKEELFPLFLTLRGWDERAKEENVPLPNLTYFRNLVIQHLINN